MSWNAGYVTDVEYSFGYYGELSPVRTDHLLTMAGIRAPTVKNACDLGFGQGVSLAVHAAAQPDVTWWGTDFNPNHVAFAKGLLAAAGANAKVFDQSFDEFCGRDDLPEFEFIALHGIWSWISDDNRSVIVDFIRRKLAVGGILYISYNTLPGWSVQAPMRHLLKEHDLIMGTPGVARTQRIDNGLAFLEQLFTTQPAYTRNNPSFLDRARQLTSLNRNYLAHEYLNASWSPTYFTDVARQLEDAKVSYGTVAHFIEQQDSISLTADQNAFLSQIADVNFRETIRDFMTSQQFRRDIWMKGLLRTPVAEQAEKLRRSRFILTTPHDNVPTKIVTMQGEAELQTAVYNPVLDALADNKIHSFQDLEVTVAKAGVPFGSLANALSILMSMGAVGLAQSEEMIRKAKPLTSKLNAHLFREAVKGGQVTYVASPVTGGGIPMGRFPQMFLAARAQGLKTPQEWAKAVCDTLSAQGQSLKKDGKPVQDPTEALTLMLPDAQQVERQLPMLQSLGII